MIGSYGRTTLGGRVGAKRNRKTSTISPVGSKIKPIKMIGSMKKPSQIGKVSVKKSIGSSKKS